MDSEAYEEMISLQEQHWWFVARRKIVQSFLKKHMSNKFEANVLEIGCGVGGNVELLGTAGRYLGIDMHMPAIEYCSQKFPKFDFICSRVEDISNELYANKFDSIFILDVLEHIHDEKVILAAARSYLKIEGKILVTVPAYQFLWAPHDDFVHHVRRYTKRRLRKVLEESGYKVERISYFNTLLLLPAIIQRLTTKLLNRKLSTHLTTPPRPINWIFKEIFSQETRILKHLNSPAGLSIIAVVTK